ncbi:hypothetical protein ENSA5_24870 [Enhygromyxa salina]|uniref:Uncharacterized protein n=1 Tax=Enhygromyxa salina TaxID=215803 RepID=A0A2S9YB61_9BACT|nr:hypothetical protein [Enhygromyxa salina]PRQ02251.1 hypothetical protein ENSA5_24870 [Enhygromyxa salina]
MSEGPRGSAVARRIGWVALALVLVLGPLVVRAWIDGRGELRQADAAAELGDVDAQIRHLGRAARWRLPIASHDDRARARLEEIAELAAETGELDEALAAWRELRGALLGTRAIGVVDPEQLRAANLAIVELMARQAAAASVPSERERWAAELDEDLGSRWQSLLAAACFGGWLIGCVGFFVQGIDAKGRLDPRPALRWGGSILVLMVGWILLM